VSCLEVISRLACDRYSRHYSPGEAAVRPLATSTVVSCEFGGTVFTFSRRWCLKGKDIGACGV